MAKRNRFVFPMDRITEDGILCSIISLLPLKEAVRTCVLSRRWRKIWTYLPNLDFDAVNMFDSQIPDSLNLTEREEELLAGKTDQFITSVNSVLQQRPAGTRIEKFTIWCYLHNKHSDHLDAWICFLVESKIKKLVLCLQPLGMMIEPYHFPCGLLELSTIEELSLDSCSLKPPHGFGGLRYLKFLTLDETDVTETDVKYLLSNCFSLERLQVALCDQLVTLSIPYPLSRLEYLCVEDCHVLRKIEINAKNLTTLVYYGKPVEFIFRESSLLTKAEIHFRNNNGELDLPILPINLPYLEYLNYGIRGYLKATYDRARNINRFTHLRHLVWTVAGLFDHRIGLMLLGCLLSAAPLLEKLSLEFIESPNGSISKPVKQRKASPHTHLKIVEITGFTGHKWHLEVAVYLLNNAIKLELMTLLQDSHYNDDISKKLFEINMMYIRQQVPKNVELVIL